MGVPLPQADCWWGSLVRWPDVEMLEQSLHMLVLLVLSFVGDWPSCVPWLLAIVCDYAKYFAWQLFFLQWFRAKCRCDERSFVRRGTHGQSRIFVLPEMSDVHLKLLLGLARKISHHHNSVGDFLFAIVHLELLAISPLNDQVWVGSKPYTVLLPRLEPMGRPWLVPICITGISWFLT